MVLSRQWGEDSGRARLKCDGTRAETRFGLSSKRTSPFKSAGGGGALHSTTGSRGVRISGSNAGYTFFFYLCIGHAPLLSVVLHACYNLFTFVPVLVVLFIAY